MKKVYRIFITIMLIMSISVTSMNVLASGNSSKIDISGFDLVGLKENMEDDPLVQEVTLEGNTLRYSTTDGTVASISVQQNNGIETVSIIENGKEDIITADLNSNDVFLNGEPVKMTIEYVDEIPEIMPLTDWTFVGLSYPNVEHEKAISSLVPSALIALIAYSTGNPDLTYEGACLIINRLIAIGSATRTLYVRRMTFRDSTWTRTKYNDNYFANGNYDDAGWLYVLEHEFYGGTR